jgi:probable dihydroxyacetone kinase regulator
MQYQTGVITMEADGRNTKLLISESYKKLVLLYPYEKITIKMITDGAGLIRPTFYNHFRDKNEVFEWILQEELINILHSLINNKMEKEAIKMIFVYFGNNKEFYKRLFMITGQNSFEEVFENSIFRIFFQILKNYSKDEKKLFLTRENISRYYSMGLVYIIKMWISDADRNNMFAPEEVYESYIFLITHSLLDYID